jgi:rod shape-determining protein MreC
MLKRNIYIIIIALVVLITIIPSTRRATSRAFFALFGGLSNPISKVASPAQKFFSGIGAISKIKDENNQLAAKLQKLKLDSSELEELRVENKILRNQLGFAEEHREYELVGAKIIGRDPVSFMDSIIVDKGSDEGITLGAVAISDGALAGKVTGVFNHQSKVTLITSKDSIVQVMLQGSRVMGVLRGGLSGLTLENIPQDIEVESGEGVVTSGLGGSIDQGILVGEVVGQNSSKAQIYKTLSIRPTVDFSKLELIFIIK